MDTPVAAVYDPESEYELVIPQWETGVNPEHWTLEAQIQGEWVPAAGRKIVITLGERLRNGNSAMMQTMIDHGFIKAVVARPILKQEHNDDNRQ